MPGQRRRFNDEVMGWTTTGIVARFPTNRRDFYFVPGVQTISGTHLPSYSVGDVTTHRILTRLLSTCTGNIFISTFRGKQFFDLLSSSE